MDSPHSITMTLLGSERDSARLSAIMPGSFRR